MQFKNFLSVAATWVLLLPTDMGAQNYFRNEYSPPTPEVVMDLAHTETYDGGMVLLSRMGNLSGDLFLNVQKIDATGNVVWTQRLQFATAFDISNIVEGSDSSVSFCVDIIVLPAGEYQFFRFSANGTLIAQKKLTPPAPYKFSYAPVIVARNDGGYYLSGDVHHPTTLYEYWHACAISASGAVQWSTLVLGYFAASDIHSADTCANGDLLIVGSQMPNPSTGPRAVIARVDKQSGNLLLANMYDPGSNLNTFDVVHDSLWNFYLVGAHDIPAPTNNTHGYILKLDSSFNAIWGMIYSHPTLQIFARTATTGLHNSVVIAGGLPSSQFGFALEIDTAGNVQWSRSYPDATSTMSIAPFNGYGYSMSVIPSSTQQNQIFTVDTTGQGCKDYQAGITGVRDTVITTNLTGSMTIVLTEITTTDLFNPIPVSHTSDCSPDGVAGMHEAEWKLFPNPAQTTITLQGNGQIEQLKLINTLGQTVYESSPLTSTFTISVEALSPGLYYLTCQSADGLGNYPIVIAR